MLSFSPRCIRNTQALSSLRPASQMLCRICWYLHLVCQLQTASQSFFSPANKTASTNFASQIGAKKSRTWLCLLGLGKQHLASCAVRLFLLQGQCVSCSPNPPAQLCAPLDFSPQIQTQQWRSSFLYDSSSEYGLTGGDFMRTADQMPSSLFRLMSWVPSQQQRPWV